MPAVNIVVREHVAAALVAVRREALAEAERAMPGVYRFSDYPDLQRTAESAVHVFRGYIRALADKAPT